MINERSGVTIKTWRRCTPRFTKKLCSTGLALIHDKPMWRNEHGDIVQTENEAYGCESPYKLIHPDWLLFVDECGSNTPQTNDAQVGGQKFLCAASGHPQQ
jgi:hypothetical protein